MIFFPALLLTADADGNGRLSKQGYAGWIQTRAKYPAALTGLQPALLIYPLFVSVGVATLNGRILALWIGAAWWLAWSVITISSMFGIFWPMLELEAIAFAGVNVAMRRQLFSLLCVLSLFGVATHASALHLHHTRMPSAARPRSAP